MKCLSLWMMCLVLPALSCRDVTRLHGTALVVTVEAGGLEIDQLRYSSAEGETAVFGPETRPEPAAGPLASTTSVRVLLADSLAGQTMEIFVEGLSAGAVVGQGRARVDVVPGVERPVTVLLAAPMSGCDNCQGCCSNGNCVTSPNASACGIGGAACSTCDVLTTTTCGADGRCACGVGPPCTAAIGADKCAPATGECLCGTGPACEPGVECLRGLCQCTAASCPSGCCMGGRCLMGDTSQSCGLGGRACLDCLGSACTAGTCATSACNATNCPGCCSGSRCLTGTDDSACGVSAMGCLSCGLGSCDAGACVNTCNPQTCPAGCCLEGDRKSVV